MKTHSLTTFAFNVLDITVFMAQMSFYFMLLGAFLTHIVHCYMAVKPLLLIVGALISPIGIIHGVSLWFI